MLATFLIEITLLVYTFLRYKLSPITRVIMLALFFLALFQLAEYSVCGRFQLSAAAWSRMGYVAITMLPPLVVHLVLLIAKRSWQWLVWIAYASGIAWAGIFGLSQCAFTGYVCEGNYVIFQLSKAASRFYSTYYYFWLGVGMALAVYFAVQSVGRVREALVLQAMGYVVFLLPTAIIGNLNQGVRQGIPSIMCGFAILYALILVFGILPRVLYEPKEVSDS